MCHLKISAYQRVNKSILIYISLKSDIIQMDLRLIQRRTGLHRRLKILRKDQSIFLAGVFPNQMIYIAIKLAMSILGSVATTKYIL